MRRLIIAAITATALAGCAEDVANRYYASQAYPPKPLADVEILTAPPNRPHDVIADFQSRGDTPKSLQKKAAKIGADAIIVTRLGGLVPSGNEWAGQKTVDGDRIFGTAIKYK